MCSIKNTNMQLTMYVYVCFFSLCQLCGQCS